LGPTLAQTGTIEHGFDLRTPDDVTIIVEAPESPTVDRIQFTPAREVSSLSELEIDRFIPDEGQIKGIRYSFPESDFYKIDFNGDSDISSETASPEITPDINHVFVLSLCMRYAFYRIDEYIDTNGLRPVVDEMKRRRWALTLTVAVYAAVT